MQAMVGVAITCAIVAAYGIYLKKREREEWKARRRKS
jgi:hypothetical protein